MSDTSNPNNSGGSRLVSSRAVVARGAFLFTAAASFNPR